MPLTKVNNYIIGWRGYCFVIDKSALTMTCWLADFRKIYVEYIFVPVLFFFCPLLLVLIFKPVCPFPLVSSRIC